MVFMTRGLIVMLMVLLMAACSARPDATRVQHDVEQRLSEAFPVGLLALDAFER